jgi:hypothetical protein
MQPRRLAAGLVFQIILFAETTNPRNTASISAPAIAYSSFLAPLGRPSHHSSRRESSSRPRQLRVSAHHQLSTLHNIYQ